eukprot:COSAG01_NODE_11560_length_1903_cov_3.194568_1_plen_383_part_00
MQTQARSGLGGSGSASPPPQTLGDFVACPDCAPGSGKRKGHQGAHRKTSGGGGGGGGGGGSSSSPRGRGKRARGGSSDKGVEEAAPRMTWDERVRLEPGWVTSPEEDPWIGERIREAYGKYTVGARTGEAESMRQVAAATGTVLKQLVKINRRRWYPDLTERSVLDHGTRLFLPDPDGERGMFSHGEIVATNSQWLQWHIVYDDGDEAGESRALQCLSDGGGPSSRAAACLRRKRGGLEGVVGNELQPASSPLRPPRCIAPRPPPPPPPPHLRSLGCCCRCGVCGHIDGGARALPARLPVSCALAWTCVRVCVRTSSSPDLEADEVAHSRWAYRVEDEGWQTEEGCCQQVRDRACTHSDRRGTCTPPPPSPAAPCSVMRPAQ